MDESRVPQVLKVSATLQNPMDWHTWIAQIHRVALMHEIWEYIDPRLKEQPEEPDPDEIEAPHPSKIREGVELPGSLTDEEYRTFQWKIDQYNRDYRTAERAQSNLAEMMVEIDRTVAQSYKYLLHGCFTPWSMLSRLQGALKPTPADIARRYRDLLNLNHRSISVEELVKRWGAVVQEAEDAKMGITCRAPYDFLDTIECVDPVFACFWSIEMQEGKKEEEIQPILNAFYAIHRNKTITWTRRKG